MSTNEKHATGAGIALAFAAVYLIWGSTYLAIRVAVVEFAPFVMASLRFMAAGLALYLYLRLRGEPRPTWSQWRSACLVGFLLLTCSNAAITWAMRTVESGLTAVLCAVVPVWMVILDWARDRKQRPSLQVVLGVLVGIVGVVVLIGPSISTGSERVDLFGATLIVLGSLTWALGSMFSRSASLPKSAPMSTAMQMLGGGAFLAVAAALNGDWQQFQPAEISLRAWLYLAYLGVFGSIIGLSAYVWLLQVTTPARVSTYAYVNPVVAVILGWAILGEPLGPRTIVATAIIVAAVVVITTQGGRTAKRGKSTPIATAASTAITPTATER